MRNVRGVLAAVCLVLSVSLALWAERASAQDCDSVVDCDDGDECTQNLCADGTCAFPLRPLGSACTDDGDACTRDQCLLGVDGGGVACRHNPVAPGSPCPDDGNTCTTDRCQFDGSGFACVHQAVPPGSPCTEDGDACTFDRCQFTDTGPTCTHQVVPPGTECPDDGNACTLDMCQFGDGGMACTHPPLPPGSSCTDDGNQCTLDLCQFLEGGIGCAHMMMSPGTVCDDGSPCTEIDACDISGTCAGFGPPFSCRSAEKASVVIKNGPGSDRDLVDYKWTRGAATELIEMGDPTTSTAYTLCVFDNAMRLKLSADVPAGESCGDVSCWRPKSKGYRYDDDRGLADGVGKIRLTAGLEARSSVHVRGSGAGLDLPVLPLAAPVTVQVINSDTGVCFGTTFSSPSASSTKKFIAKAP